MTAKRVIQGIGLLIALTAATLLTISIVDQVRAMRQPVPTVQQAP